jgi:indole-3-glycerol phosphate synthase
MNILEQIVEVKKDEVKSLRSEFRYRHFSDSEFFDLPVLSMKGAVMAENDISIIAEIKKASPSAGIIREDFNHLEIADIYMENEVDAISVLTDQNFFQGHISFLSDIAKSRIVPLLRKDFIIDDIQIYEARSNGADCILLIAEILSGNQLAELTHAAVELGLETLVEIHSAGQIQKFNFLNNSLVGINNRNLENFKVNLESTAELADLIPDQVALVSESGIKSSEDLDFLKETRINAVLVGEHFMRQTDISREIAKFKKWAHREN